MIADVSRISEMVSAGFSLGEIEEKLLEADPSLDEDERAALWLYAWASACHAERASPAPSRRLSAGWP